MPQDAFAPLQMNPLALRLDLSDPAGARLPNLALPALAGMGVQAGARALADFGAGISGSPTLGEQNVAARGTAAELAGLGMGVPAPPGSLSAFLGYHGTPHLFKPEPGAPFGAFRNEAIGSGEGAQAYGWGHYVAGNESVAKGYQNQLSGYGQIAINGNHYSLLDPRKAVESEFPNIVGNNQIAYPIQFMMNDMRQGLDLPAAINNMKYNYSHFEPENILQAEKLFTKANPQVSSGGHLLEVHILPEESDLLDWDKRLGEQDPQMLDKLQASGLLPSYNPMQLTGEGFYRDLSRRYADKLAANLGGTTARELGPRAASQALDAAGIPGLRYLDAGSRGKQPFIVHAQNDKGDWFQAQQFPTRQMAENFIARNPINAYDFRIEENPLTHNYVLFHPRHLRIIGRNGERLEPVEGDPFAGAGGQ